MTTPEADRPQYADGTPVPDSLDETTQQWSRGLNPTTGAKGGEPAEPVPAIASIAPATGPAAGGTGVTLTGTNFGGSTGVTFGGAAATSVVVVSETSVTCTTPAGTIGARDVIAQNPAGNSAPLVGGFTYA